MSSVKLCTGVFVGCFSSCQTVDTGLIAKHTGTHQINYNLGGTVHQWTFQAIKGFPLCFPNKFRENGESCFTITQPNNSLYTYDEDCNFYLKNTISFNQKKALTLTKIQEIKQPIHLRPTTEKQKIKFLK